MADKEAFKLDLTPHQRDMLQPLPRTDWIKNDPKKHQWFEDGSEFLFALQVTNNRTGVTKWEFACIRVNCDDEWLALEYQGGEPYDAWEWKDFEWFILLDGVMPTVRPDESTEG